MTALKCLLIIVMITLISVFAPYAACASKEILIGATVSLEGRFKAPSKMMQLAYRLWEKETNEAGGILGRPIRLVFYNDKSKKELVRVYYDKMINEDKVDLVLAPYGTTLTHESSSVTEKHGYVLMAGAASGEMIWTRGYQYVFGLSGIAKQYFNGFLDLVDRNGLKSVAILSENTLFTKDAAEGAGIWAFRKGLDIRLYKSYGDQPDDLSALVTELEQLKPDAVILCSYPPDGYKFLEKLSKSGFKPKALAMSITPGLPDFSDKAGALAEGIFGPSQWEPDTRIPIPGTYKFINDFYNLSGVHPSYHAGAAYAGCQILKRGITAHGEINHTKIRDYVASLNTVTIFGRFKVDTMGRQEKHNMIIVQWQDNKKEVVYPNKLRTSKARFEQP